MGKYDKQDALIQTYERYTDVALALALEGKISPKDDEQAHELFTSGKEEELAKLYHRRKRELHKPVSFIEPDQALKGWKPKVFKKDDPKTVSISMQQAMALRKIKGTRLFARTLIEKGS